MHVYSHVCWPCLVNWDWSFWVDWEFWKWHSQLVLRRRRRDFYVVGKCAMWSQECVKCGYLRQWKCFFILLTCYDFHLFKNNANVENKTLFSVSILLSWGLRASTYLLLSWKAERVEITNCCLLGASMIMAWASFSLLRMPQAREKLFSAYY